MTMTAPHDVKDAMVALACAGIGTWRWDSVGERFVFSGAAQLLGAAADGLSLDGVMARVHIDDRNRVGASLRLGIADESLIDVTFRTVDPSLSDAWVRLRGRAVARSRASLEPQGILIEEPRRPADDTATSRLAAIVASSDDAIIAKTLEGIVTDWNHGAEVQFGYTAAEIIGKPIALLLPPDLQDEEGLILDRLKRGERIEHFETRRRRKDGAIIDVSLTASPLRDGAGRLVGASKVARDITAIKQAQAVRAETQKQVQDLQAELIHMSRFNALGEMASTLAHELSQPLSAVANYLKGGRRLLEGDRPDAVAMACKAMDLATEQALRAGQIIRRMRDFVARGQSDRRPEILTKLIREAGALALVGIDEGGVQTSFDLDPHDLIVFADKVQIQQVLLNLIRNAAEAMQDTTERRLCVTSRRLDDETAEVSVADTGTGIPAGIAAHLFQPFVTTKRQGMGVGLSISRTIVEAHGGRIWVEPNPAGGTIFRLTLKTRIAEEA